MTPRKDNFPHPVPPSKRPPLTVTHPDAAGIDVGAEEHWVAVPADRDSEPVRRFGACTIDLERLADWLKQCGVKTVALESTGVYWIALFELLEQRGFQVILVDARQMRSVPGRPKTDKEDCQWLQRLHSYGLLAAAFRPEEKVVVLRSYLRQRQMLLTYAAQHIQHMQKALEQMNVKLVEVVSEITGVTGMSIIEAILAGERDPKKLAKLRQRNCKRNEAGIAQALYGTWREEHLFALGQAMGLYRYYQEKLRECDQQIEKQLQTFADKSGGQKPGPGPRQGQRGRNQPAFDARGLLYCLAGVDLTAIEGIDETTALVVLSEIGVDMSRWPTDKHFCSWLGLCPRHRITGGKIFSRRVRPGANRVKVALRLAARALHRSNSALGAFFRRLKARLGTPKAITATAHKLARLIYSLLKHGAAYVAEGMAAYEAKHHDRLVNHLTRKARELGFDLVAAAGSTPTTAVP